jgi:predicted ferric reductase
MPPAAWSIPDVLEEKSIAEPQEQFGVLYKRVNIHINSTTPPALIEAIEHDPFSQASKYGLLFVYFAIILLVTTAIMRMYHYWGDKIRTALHKEEVAETAKEWSATSAMLDSDLPTSSVTDGSTRVFFPPTGPLIPQKRQQAPMSAIAPINNTIALFRWVFYRPVPPLRIWKFRFDFPSLNVLAIVFAATASSLLYCFLPQPYLYASMSYGSPPLAIRAGMISVSLLPWVVLTSSKANLLSYLTGIGHERLIVLHRWAAYLCAMFAFIHAVPYWYQSVRDESGFATFKLYFNQQYYIFTTGIAAIAPLIFLVFHSLPFLRSRLYELFVIAHAPVAYAFIGLLFWHCNNYLTSWSYLYATIALAATSLVARVFYLNWLNPLRSSFLIGEESAVTILVENAVKVTIPTQKKWKPGQYAYLRMPGVALFENHPFTIASLCSEDFPSEYGEQYRDMMLIFRPFGGFTRKLYDTAIKKGPYKTYRAYIDGPYGGMQRQMSSFDNVVFFAGGSGITAIASQVLDLVKRMRDGKATTRNVTVVWAMKRPELMEWFKEELRICREHAPPGTMQCHFFITAAKRYDSSIVPGGHPHHESQRYSGFKERINDALQGVASKRNSALVDPATIDIKPPPSDNPSPDRDTITALPNALLSPSSARRAQPSPTTQSYFPPPPTTHRHSTLSQAQNDAIKRFDFGFPATPTVFQKNLMRFAFLPTTVRRDGWRTEYGRPDIPYLLKGLAREFGRRTCVYVCGPPQMRVDVSRTVADLQVDVWKSRDMDEIYLHAENYAL